ncbi:MAG: putative bifunctional diguanylate cyclase/phosphodiesterase [Acidimicrobiales bacterium]
MNRRSSAAVLAPLFLVALYLAPGVATLGDGVTDAYVILAAAAVAIAAAGVAVHRPQPSAAWVGLVATLALWAVGDAIYLALDTDTSSLADAFYIAGSAGIITSLVVIVRHRHGGRRADRVLELAVVAVGGSYVAWEVIVAPLWNTATGDDVVTRVMSTAYPVADLVIIVLLLQIVFSSTGETLWPAAMLTLGAAVVFVADVAYAVQVQSESYVDGVLVLDAAWLFGYVAIAAAVTHPGVRRLGDPTTAAATDQAQLPQFVVASLALLTVPGVVVLARWTGRAPALVPMALVATTMVALVVWRFARIAHQLDDARRRVAASEAYYRTLTTHSSDVVIVLGRDGGVAESSPTYRRTVEQLGLAETTPLEVIHPDDRTLVRALVVDCRSTPGNVVSGEARISPAHADPDADPRWIELRCANLLDDPLVDGVVITAHEVTARKRAEAALEHQAFHDPLTLLPNRSLFNDRVRQGLARASRRGGDVAVLFCDLDNFKDVNDTLGHHSGDELLAITATRLATSVRIDDTVARMGGDEFAILVETDHADAEPDAVATAERVLAALAEPVHLSGHDVVVHASIGIAAAGAGAGGGGVDATSLLRDADLAMYRAKRSGRNQHATYHPSMRSDAPTRPELEVDLRRAVERGELSIAYQPVIEVETGRLTGFEALARWHHPERGALGPDLFVPVAEAAGLIAEIDDWVIRSALTAAAGWATSDAGTTLDIALNLSAHRRPEPDLARRVVEAAAATGIAPSRIILELPERVLVGDLDSADGQVRHLRAAGVRVAIEDFGAGTSSLAYLGRLPVDIIKIGRAFVATIDDSGAPPLVHGLLELCRSLGLRSTAQGVETMAQHHVLVDHGCETAQGFLYAPSLDERHTAAAVAGLGPDMVMWRPPVART